MRRPRVFHLLQRAHSALFRAADRALRDEIDLTTAQQAVLFALSRKDGVPISDIADQLNMGKSSLTGLVDRMSDKGLVRRQQSARDARSFEVFIEPAGRTAVESTLSNTRRVNAELLEPFSETEWAIIERFLRHVSENAETIVRRQADTDTTERKSA